MMSRAALGSVAPPTPIQFASVGSSAVIATHPSVFESIFDAAVTVCVWNRLPDPIIAHYLQESVSSGSWERKAHVDAIEPQFDDLLMGFKTDVGRVRWETELRGLVDLFSTLTDARTVGLRVTATARATCPRFHSDQVGLRMLCSWVGEGTEWLAAEDVVRDALGAQQPSFGLTAGPVRSGGVIRQMRPFAVGALKGDLWPGNEGRGAVHRSPQPQGWRVFVSLDDVC